MKTTVSRRLKGSYKVSKIKYTLVLDVSIYLGNHECTNANINYRLILW
jgi:hypothetical protein